MVYSLGLRVIPVVKYHPPHHHITIPFQVEEEEDEVKSWMGGGGGIWLGPTEVLLV